MSGVLTSCLSKSAVLACAVSLLAACASVTPPLTSHGAARTEHQASEDTEARAKRVFVYQSRVADALLDRYPLREDFAAADASLLQAESHMTEACGALTRAVVRHLEGRKQSVKQKLKVARSLDSCEAAAQRLDAMMELPPGGSSLVATGGP